MAQAVKQTTPATRRGRGKDQPAPNKLGPRNKQGLAGEDSEQRQAGHRGKQDSRYEQDFSREHDFRDQHDLTRDHAEQAPGDQNDAQDSRRDHDVQHEQDLRREREQEHAPRGENDEQWQPGDRQPGDRAEQDSRREPRRQPGGAQRSLIANAGGDRLDQSTDRVGQARSTGVGTLTPTFDFSTIFTSMFELAGAMMKAQQQAFASMFGAADNGNLVTSGDRRGNVHDASPASRTRSLVPDSIEQDRRGTGDRDQYQSQPGVQRDRAEAKSSWDGQRDSESHVTRT